MFVDHIKKDGWFYRNAYPFSYKPTQVSICKAVWRLPVFGLARLIVTFLAWCLFGLVFGLLAWMTYGVWTIAMGNKFVYNNPSLSYPTGIPGVIGENLLVRLCIFAYKIVPNKRLYVIAGERILPIYVIALAAITAIAWYLVGPVVSGVWSATAWMADQFMSLSLWIPVLLFGAFVTLGLVVYGIKEFRKSEVYALLFMSFKARMDKICPILPVK